MGLAILLDSVLNLDAQVVAAARSASEQVRLVCPLHLPLEMADLAICALVMPCLDDCSMLNTGLKLLSVWHAAARLLMGAWTVCVGFQS